MENKITFDDIQKANETIKTTDIKGKDYAEVNQRIKAFRMLYPQGTIETEMVSNENGICVFEARVGFKNENGECTVLGVGHAYEKENSTFINKTSYIENCETSAVGRALGMAGFGIDTSVASAEEVQNAMANQEPTKEEADNYKISFGRYKGKTIKEILDEKPDYIDWLLNNSKDEHILKVIELVTGKRKLTDAEWEEILNMQLEMHNLMGLLEDKETGFSREIIYDKYGSEKDYTKETYTEIINTLKKKLED